MNKLTSFLLLIFIASISLLISCNVVDQENSILNENFDSNTKGWIQERSDFHTLEIKDGFYFIENKDSTAQRTSTRSLDKSYLFNLPETYSIYTSIDIIQSDLDTAYCGLILEGTSFEYEFRFFDSGDLIVEKYDFVTKTYSIYNNIGSLSNEKKVEQFDIEIKIDGWSFEIYANNNKLGSGKMSSKSWQRLTPFAGTFTSTKVDYLKIKE